MRRGGRLGSSSRVRLPGPVTARVSFWDLAMFRLPDRYLLIDMQLAADSVDKQGVCDVHGVFPWALNGSSSCILQSLSI